MLFLRKPKLDQTAKLKAYELAVARCYPSVSSKNPDTDKPAPPWPSLKLEFFRLSRFCGFNSERLASFSGGSERDYLREDYFKLEGIVGGWIGKSLHVPAELEVIAQPALARADSHIGSYILNHYGDKSLDRLDMPLRLDIQLHDPEKLYQATLRDAMRDAAISGRGFLHVELRGLKNEDSKMTKSPLDLINEHGYGPLYTFNELVLWPEINLQNAPSWATEAHKFWRG